MKFDPFNWHEVNANEKVSFAKGRVRLLCSQEAPLYVEAEGYEALAGVGTSFDLEVSEPVTVRLDAPEGVRVFVLRPPASTHEADGEVFTNIDRKPHESGTVLVVQQAVRAFKLEQQSLLRQMRAERAALEKARPAAPSPAPEPGTEPAAAPVEEGAAE